MARQAQLAKLLAVALFGLAAHQAFVAPLVSRFVQPHTAFQSKLRKPSSYPVGNRRGRRVVCQVTPLVGETFARAQLTYQADDVHRSLVACGKVGSKEGTSFGSKFVQKTMLIRDGRCNDLNLDDHGFTMVPHELEPFNYYDEKSIVEDYYPQVVKLIQKMTGATKVLPFDHNVRSQRPGPAGKRRVREGKEILGPVMSVHNDYSEAAAVRQVEQLSKPFSEGHKLRFVHGDKPLIDPAELEDVLGNRWAFVKVWRNIAEEPIYRHPFTLCTGPSIAMDDIVTFEATYAARCKEYFFAGHSKQHEWYFYPEMERDEAIIFKTWDSAGAQFGDGNRKTTVPATYAFHTAFDDPDTPEWAEDRESLEVVTLACFPPEDEER